MNDTLFKDVEKIVIGLSGGADSVVMTHILYKKFGKDRLLCAHVNHGLRGELALRDENFARDFCESLGIELRVKRVDIKALSKEYKIGEEECGRKVRYEFFSELLGENDLVATAHNANDNAETVLLNLIRGSGVKGLCGIPFKRGNIIRPILHMSREEIEAYAKDNDLSFVTDDTNFDNKYSRNKIRNEVLLGLVEINEKAVENINKASKILNESHSLLSEIAMQYIEGNLSKAGLSVKNLKEKSFSYIKNVLTIYLLNLNIKYEEKHINELSDKVLSGGMVNLPQNILVQINRDVLIVKKQANDVLFEDLDIELDKKYEIHGKILVCEKKTLENTEKINNLLFNNAVDYDKIKSGFSATKRKSGDKFSLALGKTPQRLKNLFAKYDIPTSMRDDLLVLRDEDEIVFVEKIGVSAKYRVNEQTKNYIIIKVDEGNYEV